MAPSPEIEVIKHVVPYMWEWGALVVFLLTLNIIQAFVIKTLYKRNETQSDIYLKHIQENTAVTSETKQILQEIKGLLHVSRAR